MKQFLPIIISLLSCFQIFAQKEQKQGVTMEQTLEFLNKNVGKDIKMELARNNMQLIINFYKNGVLYKIDRIFIETLDTAKVSFSEEEKALILRCRKAEELEGKLKRYRDGCVEREILDKNIIGAYGRTNLEVGADKKKIGEIVKAFIYMIKLAQDEEYQDRAPFNE